MILQFKMWNSSLLQFLKIKYVIHHPGGPSKMPWNSHPRFQQLCFHPYGNNITMTKFLLPETSNSSTSAPHPKKNSRIFLQTFKILLVFMIYLISNLICLFSQTLVNLYTNIKHFINWDRKPRLENKSSTFTLSFK